MARVIEQLVYKITGDTQDFNKSVGTSQKNVTQFSKVAVAALGVLSVAGFIKLTKAAFDLTKQTMEFNKGMAQVATLIPNSRERVDELSAALIQLSSDTAKPVKDLTDGMYQVISAFGDGEDTMKNLEIATKAAAAGASTTTDAINLLSAVTKAYGDTSSEAQQRVSDLAFTTVRLGQTTFPELAASMQNATDMSNRLGVSQEELFGVMATLTGVTGDASKVSTQLRSALVGLYNPSNELKDMFEEMNIESGEMLIKQEGLQGSFELITKYADRTGVSLNALIGRVEGVTAVSSIGGSMADTYADKLREIEDASGATSEAFAEVTDGVNKAGFQLEQLRNNFDLLRIQLGDKFLPVFGNVIKSINGLLKILVGSKGLIGSTENIISLYEDYKRVSDELKGNIENLTEAELVNLEAKKATFAFELTKKINEQISSYESLNRELEKNSERYVKNESQISTNITTLDHLADRYGVSREELIRLAKNNQLYAETALQVNDILDANSELIRDNAQITARANDIEMSRKQFIHETAQAIHDGIIPATTYMHLNDDLSKAIDNQVRALGAQARGIERANTQFEEYKDLSDKVLENYAKDLEAHIKTTSVVESLAFQKQMLLLVEQELARRRGDAVDELEAEGEAIEELADTVEDAYDAMLDTVMGYSEAVRRMRNDDRENFIYNLEQMVVEFAKAGVDRVELAQWYSDKIQEFDEQVTEKAEAENRKRLLDSISTANQILGNITSVWGNINQVRANANEAYLQQLEDEGASEEKLASEKKRLAIEEAKRDKALRSMQTVIDTAAGIARLWVSPGFPMAIPLTATVGAVGVSQLAAIHSEPLPSFDVGSIRIPETQQAVVHRDEMILPAQMAQQARTEGISISPSGGSGQPTVLQIFLDGKKIAESGVQYINSGQVGRIDTRVVR